MRKLAWLLGVIAIVGTCVLGINYYLAQKNVKIAVAAVQKFTEDAELDQSTYRMKRQSQHSAIEIGYQKLQLAQLDEQIAEFKGGMAKARAEETAARFEINNAKLLESLGEMQDQMGGSYDAAVDRERQAAAEKSLAVYVNSVGRDKHLAYALGVLWLAFAFAAALTSDRKHI